MGRKKNVFVYSHVIPSSTGSGARIRVFYNIKAYLMMEFIVELILLGNSNYPKKRIYKDIGDNNFKITKLNHLKIGDGNSDIKLINEKKNILDWILNYQFKNRHVVKKILTENLKNYPNAIHHFEYMQNASASAGLNGKFVWSNHDNFSKRILIKSKLGHKTKGFIERIILILRYILTRSTERFIIKNINLVITLSSYENNYYKKISPKKVIFFPWSIKNSQSCISKNFIRKGKNEKFKILHLGSLDSILPFQSMFNLLFQVFPKIEKSNFLKIQLLVAGSISNNTRSTQIIKKANKYKNIEILGFVDDLTNIWEQTDLQIIASEFEIGIRTKIIESLYMKVPVVCLKETAKGLPGLKHMKNIILPNTLEEMAIYLDEIVNGKIKLEQISHNGFKLYNKHYNFENNLPIFENYIQKYL